MLISNKNNLITDDFQAAFPFISSCFDFIL